MKPPSRYLERLAGTGATGRAIAGRDWSAHPLGPPDGWPAELRTALGIVLSSKFPSFVAWGEELYFFYNDAYAIIVGARPFRDQGARFVEMWPEIWSTVGPIARRALGGEAEYHEDLPLLLDRPGLPPQAYFTFSYSPIQTDEGAAGGMLCVVVETTDKVAAIARYKQSEERLQLSLDASGNIGTWSYDPGTGLAVVDERFARLFDVEVDAALAGGGTPLDRFTGMIHPDDRERVLGAIARSIATGAPYEVEYRIPQRSGRDTWVAVRGGMFRDEQAGEPRFAGVAVDITERKAADEALRALAARQAYQLELFDRINRLGAADEIIGAASELLGERLGASRVLYAEVDDEAGTFSCRRGWTAEGAGGVACQARVMADFGPAVIDELRAGRAVVIDDVEHDDRTAACAGAYRASGVRAALFVPLVKAASLRGVLSVHGAEPRRWGPEAAQLAQDTAERTWLAVETARARAELRAERDLSRSVFDSMAEGFALLDRDWVLLQVNEVGSQLAGRPAHELVGHDHWEVMRETVGTEIEALYRQVRATGRAGTVEYLHGAGSAQARWLEIRAYPLPGEQLAVFFRDVTERKRAAEALEQASARKDEFLAMLAHELRNPLAPIRAAAELLSMADIDEARVKKTSAVIARQVKHMTGLVDDLLDVSRVTRGLVDLDRADLDMKAVVADALEQVRPLVEARHHHLAVHMPPEPAHVLGDQKRLVQVLTNLLNNAAKYTPEGGHLSVRMDVRADRVLLVVADDGIGMSPEMTECAFDLFTQAKRSSDRSQGGLGIGLALVKSLVELHHGTVSAASEGPGAGTRLTVSLPRLASPAAAESPEPQAGASSPARPLRVLVVDDNEDAAEMLAMFLETSGHQVSVEHGAPQALARARAERPDVCLLDIGLPGMDGNELARRLRARPETAEAVLIAVSGYGQERDRQESAAAGFDHHLVKPIAPPSLAALLARVGKREPRPGPR